MKIEIKIPAMGESISEATIGAILKENGSYVEENEALIELETEKVNQELYAPSAGVVNWKVVSGQSVAVGDLIGWVDKEGQPIQKKEEKKTEPTPSHKEEKPLKKKSASKESSRRGKKEFVADILKKEPVIEERIVEKKESDPFVRRKMSKIRKTIAARLVHSLHESAMLTTFNEVDMTQVMAMREKYKESFLEKHEVKLGFMSFFVKAVVEALKEFPAFNSFIEGEEIVERTSHDIGIAVGTDRGLVVPVVRGCNGLTFAEIERAIATYAQKARTNKLSIGDLQGGSFTITNGGVYGSLLSTPILNPPQVGILGMHKIMKRPIVTGDEIIIRPMMYLALSYDHRIVDGKEAVLFLVRIKDILEDPARLLFMDKSYE